MHFYDLHLGVLRFFAGAKAEIAGFMATGLPCGLLCDDVLARFYVVFASQSYVSGRFCLGFMILGVVGLRCVGVLACLGFFGACCGLIGWLLAGLENKGQWLIFAGFGSRNGEICRAFRGRLLFSHAVRVLGLENIKRQRGH